MTAEIDEESVGGVVNGEDEATIGGGGDVRDVGGGLEGEGEVLRLEEVGGRDAVAARGEKDGVVRDHGVAPVVGGAQEILEAKVHSRRWRSSSFRLHAAVGRAVSGRNVGGGSA